METTTPKPFVFVLMPFDASFDDVYKLGIKPAAEGAGAYCERIDEQIFAESILQRIYNQITKADLIVADMTGRNPNVFYEVGYAHAIGKTAILLTRNADDIPFDLKHYPHIIYGGSITGLKDDLGKRIAYHLANPEKEVPHETSRLEFSIAGIGIEPGVDIEIRVDTQRNIEFEAEIIIGANNPGDTVVNWAGMTVGLILPEYFLPYHMSRAVQLPDKRFLHAIGTIGQLLPGQWDTLEANLKVNRQGGKSLRKVPAELRIFTPTGPESTPFFLSLVEF
jgi:hypothetical protein